MSAPGNCVLTIAAPPSSTPPRFILAGNMVRFLMSFTNVAGAPANPTTVTAVVGTSYADEVSLTPVMDSTGQWHADWDTSAAIAATYYCDVAGTGALEVGAEISIKIQVPHL